jgi:hypothetical protein
MKVFILGWQPRHKGFVDEIVTCFESWKAYQSQGEGGET